MKTWKVIFDDGEYHRELIVTAWHKVWEWHANEKYNKAILIDYSVKIEFYAEEIISIKEVEI